MKKILSIAIIVAIALIALVVLTGCGTKTIVGDWEYEGGLYVYHFNEDGTGDYSGMNLTYTEDNGKVEILYDGWDNPLEATWEGDVLTVVDSFGNNTIYNRK